MIEKTISSLLPFHLEFEALVDGNLNKIITSSSTNPEYALFKVYKKLQDISDNFNKPIQIDPDNPKQLMIVIDPSNYYLIDKGTPILLFNNDNMMHKLSAFTELIKFIDITAGLTASMMDRSTKERLKRLDTIKFGDFVITNDGKIIYNYISDFIINHPVLMYILLYEIWKGMRMFISNAPNHYERYRNIDDMFRFRCRDVMGDAVLPSLLSEKNKFGSDFKSISKIFKSSRKAQIYYCNNCSKYSLISECQHIPSSYIDFIISLGTDVIFTKSANTNWKKIFKDDYPLSIFNPYNMMRRTSLMKIYNEYFYKKQKKTSHIPGLTEVLIKRKKQFWSKEIENSISANNI